jgi:serine/threonine protein kinase
MDSIGSFTFIDLRPSPSPPLADPTPIPDLTPVINDEELEVIFDGFTELTIEDRFVQKTKILFGKEARFDNIPPWNNKKTSNHIERQEKIENRIKSIYNANLDFDYYKDQLHQTGKKNKIIIQGQLLSVDRINNNGNIEDYYITGHRIGKGSFKSVKRTINRNTGLIHARVSASYKQVMIGFDLKAILEKEYQLQALFKEIKEFVQLEYTYTNTYSKKVIAGLEYCNAGDLEAFLKDNENLKNTEQLKTIFQDIFYALWVMEETGIAHKDIKPANIFLHKDENGHIHAKIGDFGFATKNDQPSDFAGTPEYFSFDILKECALLTQPISIKNPPKASAKGTAKADVWSTGQIIYELIYNKLLTDELELNNVQKIIAFAKNDTQEKMDERLEAKKHSLKNPNPFIQTMEGIMRQLLIVDPDARPTAKETYAAYCEQLGLKKKSLPDHSL